MKLFIKRNTSPDKSCFTVYDEFGNERYKASFTGSKSVSKLIVSDNAEEITNDKEIVVSIDFDIDTIVDNAVQVMEDVTSDDSSLVSENSACEEETSTSTYADVSDSDINKMADLIVQEMVETSSQSVVQDNSVTEINNESADVQLWAE